MKRFFFLLLFAVSVAQAQDLSALSSECQADPLSRGYSTMTPEQVFADMTAAVQPVVRDSMTAAEIMQALDIGEFRALTDSQRQEVLLFLGASDTHDPRNGSIAFVYLSNIFTAINGPQTRNNLGVARTVNVSRLEQLGLSGIRVAHVAQACSP